MEDRDRVQFPNGNITKRNRFNLYKVPYEALHRTQDLLDSFESPLIIAEERAGNVIYVSAPAYDNVVENDAGGQITPSGKLIKNQNIFCDYCV